MDRIGRIFKVKAHQSTSKRKNTFSGLKFFFKNEEEADSNKMPDGLLFESNYSNKQINILDICSGNLNHVNLKQVVILYLNESRYLFN